MRHPQSLHLAGASAPAAQFGRVARTIPAPQRLAMAGADSAAAACCTRRTAAVDRPALPAAAPGQRLRPAGARLASLLRGALALLRGWHARYRRHADARAIHRELAGLDGRTLRDLGIHHRGELAFIAQRLAHGEDLHDLRGQR